MEAASGPYRSLPVPYLMLWSLPVPYPRMPRETVEAAIRSSQVDAGAGGGACRRSLHLLPSNTRHGRHKNELYPVCVEPAGAVCDASNLQVLHAMPWVQGAEASMRSYARLGAANLYS